MSSQNNNSNRNMIIYLAIGLLVGFGIMRAFFYTPPSVVKDLKDDLEKERVDYKRGIDSIQKIEVVLERTIDSTKIANDSILNRRLSEYNRKIYILSKIRDEEINRINSVDSAYIDILSRQN